MERADNDSDNAHIIHITSSSDATSSSSSLDRLSPASGHQWAADQPSTSSRASVYQPQSYSSGGSNSRNSSLVQRGNNRGRQSPLNSGIWISIELVLTVSQIIAAVVVLSLSEHEEPYSPLKTWIIGYASGCLAIIPLLYWRYKYQNQGSGQDSSQQSQNYSPTGNAAVQFSRRTLGEEDRWISGTEARGAQSNELPNARLRVFVENFKMALDCFFAVWFVVGNVWMFGGRTSASEAPNLYRLCIVFLSFSCIGYAMPFILCATICCCLPCIISLLGGREDLSQNRGASESSINSLPTYKFKVNKSKSSNDKGKSLSDEGGILAAGTEKERTILGEDAVCCICLAKYSNNDELRELPCCHFFHKQCVDKWLKMKASCPLCKAEVGDMLSTLAEATASLRNSSLL